MHKTIRPRISNWRKWKSAFIVVSSSTGIFAAYSTYTGNEHFYKDYLMPVFRLLDAETSHKVAVKAAKYRIIPRMKQKDTPSLETKVFGIKFKNPVGLAAGFDKHGEAVDGLLKMGFGFVEVGSVTPKPQKGNPKPRVFRLPENKAIINRYGFNSDGHAIVHTRLKARQTMGSETKDFGSPIGPDPWLYDRNRANVIFWSPGTWSEFFSVDALTEVLSKSFQSPYYKRGAGDWEKDRNFLNVTFWSPGCWTELPNVESIAVAIEHSPHIPTNFSKVPGIVGVNLGKNKEAVDTTNDFILGVRKFGDVADYLVINISSPNTPGLRDMQGRENLQHLVDNVVEERNTIKVDRKPPIVVKIAPDLTEKDKIDIAAVVAKPGSGIDGLIISNTTISRPDCLVSSNRSEVGGLSGQPLKNLSTQCIRDMYRLTHGRLPIIGAGGIASGEDALEKIESGASLVQVYTAMAYDGPPVVTKIKRELTELLKERGYSTISQAVGAYHRKSVTNDKQIKNVQTVDAYSGKTAKQEQNIIAS